MKFLSEPPTNKAQAAFEQNVILHSVETIATCIWYNPILSIQVLDRHNWTARFFAEWFSRISTLDRVYDKKICLLALSAMMKVLPHLPTSLQQNAHQIISAALKFFDGWADSVAG
jgi:importin-7